MGAIGGLPARFLVGRFWEGVGAVHEGGNVARGCGRDGHLRGGSLFLLSLQRLLVNDLWLDHIGHFLLLDGRCCLDGSRFQNAEILVYFSLFEDFVHDGAAALHVGSVEGLGQSLGTGVVSSGGCQSLGGGPVDLLSALGRMSRSRSLDRRNTFADIRLGGVVARRI